MKTNRKKLIGDVISDKMDKTITIMVKRKVKHPVFEKYITKFFKFKAHDEKNEFKVGDRVLVEESRPLSSQKKWKVSKAIEKI